MSLTVYLNGEFVPYEKAVVPVEDRGYLFADGVYEAIRFYGKKPFAMHEHFVRLEQSAAAIKLVLPPTEELIAAALQTVARNEAEDVVLYLQATRGHAPRRHEFPDRSVSANIFMIARVLARPAAQLLEEGVSCITVPDTRWQRCNIKSISLLPNVLAKQQAAEAGAAEAIFVRDGVVMEGGSSNFFLVREQTVWTHPLSERILGGITRDLLLELARQMNISVREEAFGPAALVKAEEAFITSTGIEVLPVTSIDGRPVGNGRPGPLTKRLWHAYDDLVAKI